GTPVQCRGGETLPPRQEYRTGIGPPAGNAVLVTVIELGAAGAGSGGLRCPQPATSNTAPVPTARARRTRRVCRTRLDTAPRAGRLPPGSPVANRAGSGCRDAY